MLVRLTFLFPNTPYFTLTYGFSYDRRLSFYDNRTNKPLMNAANYSCIIMWKCVYSYRAWQQADDCFRRLTAICQSSSSAVAELLVQRQRYQIYSITCSNSSLYSGMLHTRHSRSRLRSSQTAIASEYRDNIKLWFHVQ